MNWTLLAQAASTAAAYTDYKELTAYAVVLGIAGGSVLTMRRLVSKNDDRLWNLWTTMVSESNQTRMVFEKAVKTMEADSKADREAYLMSMGQVTAELREMNASIGELKRSRQWRRPGDKPGEGTPA
jgi:crotonobetainyl-CoA:carnitine CoA-transferase CaiB-like acyl-CoA transferase